MFSSGLSSYYNHYTYEENRNSSIDLLLPGIIKLTEKKYSAIRMGSIIKENISSNNNKIINYANSSSRNDLFRHIFNFILNFISQLALELSSYFKENLK